MFQAQEPFMAVAAIHSDALKDVSYPSQKLDSGETFQKDPSRSIPTGKWGPSDTVESLGLYTLKIFSYTSFFFNSILSPCARMAFVFSFGLSVFKTYNYSSFISFLENEMSQMTPMETSFLYDGVKTAIVLPTQVDGGISPGSLHSPKVQMWFIQGLFYSFQNDFHPFSKVIIY